VILIVPTAAIPNTITITSMDQDRVHLGTLHNSGDPKEVINRVMVDHKGSTAVTSKAHHSRVGVVLKEDGKDREDMDLDPNKDGVVQDMVALVMAVLADMVHQAGQEDIVDTMPRHLNKWSFSRARSPRRVEWEWEAR
jgi:hypothetical protein